MVKSTQVIWSAWALKALRTELYASFSSWWICASMLVSPYILEYGTEPAADLPFPATRPPLEILFWCDGGRSSSVPAIFFQNGRKIRSIIYIRWEFLHYCIYRNVAMKSKRQDIYFGCLCMTSKWSDFTLHKWTQISKLYSTVLGCKCRRKEVKWSIKLSELNV